MTLEQALALYNQLYAAVDFNGAKPEGVSDKYWKALGESQKFTESMPLGERGVRSQKSADSSEYAIEVFGSIESWTLADFRYYLERAGEKKVRVKIASQGGNAAVGLGIYQLIAKRGNVVTETYGPIASAASIIWLGGEERLVDEIATSVVVHNSWLMAFYAGNAQGWDALNKKIQNALTKHCLLYTSPSPRD